MLEIQIKRRLIDYLLQCKCHQKFILISELPFMDKQRRADLVLAGDEGLHAFEIKGDKDDLRKLSGQLPHYQKCFDSVTLVTSVRHAETLRLTLPSGVGLILIDNNQVSRIRNAKIRKRLQKKPILNLLTRSELEAVARSINYRPSARSKLELIDSLPKKINLSQIKNHSHKILRKKYYQKFEFFLRERGNVTLEEDVQTLTYHKDSELDK